jgi:acylaminoacyl-peptidase
VGKAQLEGVEMAPYHAFSFAGWNGETVQGFVVEPVGREPGRKYPVVFVIHGGPHGAYNNAWSYLRSPQVWSGKGYATVLINFHGSTGFGEAFSQSVHGHWGDRPLEDLQKGWAAAQAQFPWLDGSRACALGSSFGGFMVNWIAGAWNEPWRCLVTHAGVFDVRAAGLSGDLVWYKDVQMGGSPVTNPEAFERFNPRSHVAKWKKPILFTHGGRDLRVTVNESVAGHIAAQRVGVPSEFLYMPDASHSVIRPQDMRDWYAAVNAWLDRWTAPQGAQ